MKLTPNIKTLWTVVVIAILSTLIQPQPSRSESYTNPSVEQKAFIASKIYAMVQTSFAHWSAVPKLDLDLAYKAYLTKAMSAKTRKDFVLATLEFMALLHNGHSHFFDKSTSTNSGLPFSLDTIEDKWVVVRSYCTELKPGDVVDQIDNVPIEKLFQSNKKYISESSERAQRTMFTAYDILFPDSFEVTLNSGAKIRLKQGPPVVSNPPRRIEVEGRWLEEGRIAYIYIPAFDEEKFENQSVEFVKKFANANTLIIDVRNNRGGSTPTKLIKALMNSDWRSWVPSRAIVSGLSDFYENSSIKNEKANFVENNTGTWDECYVELFKHATISGANNYISAEKGAYAGKLLILTGRRQGSAGEDFVEPFKDNHRALIIGETTKGSTGQPVSYNFDNGFFVMISAVRETFPDGSPFEGIGVTPDVEVKTTIESLKSGHDQVLEKALQLAK